MTYAAILGLVIYWFVAGSNFTWERAWPHADPLVGNGWKSVLNAIPYALWWLIIIEGVALAAEETHQPHRSIPRGLVWAMLTVIAMVVLTLSLTAGAVPWHQLDDDYPLASVVKAVAGDGWLAYGFGVIALFGLIASYHGLLYSTSRQAFALARAGYLPSWLGEVHASRRTPVPALLVCSLITAGFVIASVMVKDSIDKAILVAGLAALILYLLSMVCLLRLRHTEPALFKSYRAPLGRLLPAAVVALSALAVCVYPNIKNGGVALVIAVFVYALGMGCFLFRRRSGEASAAADANDTAAVAARQPSWLDRLAAASLVAALLTVAWIYLSAFQPDWLRLDLVEAEIIICIVVFTMALVLVCSAAIAHTTAIDPTPEESVK
jgi:ethanolamine permease